MVDCRMLQGPLAGQIISVAADDAANGASDGWATPIALFDSYPWPWDVDRAELATAPPPSFDEWVEAGSPPGAPHGQPQPVIPVLASISPVQSYFGGAAPRIVCNGEKFIAGATVFASHASFPADVELTNVIVVSATQIAGTLPQSTQSVGKNSPISIYIQQGTAKSESKTFQYVAPPALSVSMLMPSQSSASAADPIVTVMGNGFDSTCKVIQKSTGQSDIELTPTGISISNFTVALKANAALAGVTSTISVVRSSQGSTESVDAAGGFRWTA